MSARAVAAVALPPPRPGPLREARKWGRMFAVFAQDALAYRAVALIWLLTDIIPTLANALVWLAAYRGRPEIGGIAPGQMLAYFLTALVVTNLVQCHQMWEMAADIKEGRFSAYLVRPFSYRAMNYLGFLAWRLLRTVLAVPILAVVALCFRGYFHAGMWHLGPLFWASLVGAHFLSFFLTYAFGLTALYLVETRSLFNFWYIPVTLFSGQFAPIALFPPAARALADILPFRYTIALPTEAALGLLTDAQVGRGLLIQAGWIAAAFVLGTLLWRDGTRRFTGVGL